MSEWFLGFTAIIPTLFFLNIFISFQSQNFHIETIFFMYLFAILLNLLTSIYFIREIPMLNGMLNSIISAHYIVVDVNVIICFVDLYYDLKTPISMVMLSTALFAILFVIINLCVVL